MTKSKPKIPKSPKPQGLEFPRTFCPDDDGHPYYSMEWTKQDVTIGGDTGTVFTQKDVEAPSEWSKQAVQIAASKYFHGDQALGVDPATGGRENTIGQLITRVVSTIATWGLRGNYFAGPEDLRNFQEDLFWLCANQYGAFNSPVWFNVGLHQHYGVEKAGSGNFFWNGKAVEESHSQTTHPQGAACFLLSVKDTMEDIMRLAATESHIFKHGSGAGTNLSSLRSTRETISGGGKPSGPLSFLRVYDSVAGVTKSGGVSRRAAKMNMLDTWHPDVEEFIEAKSVEERKAHALIAQGYPADYNGAAYGTVAFQNVNLSVRASDEFMAAAIAGKPWWTKRVTDGQPCEEKDAKTILHDIAKGTWFCGDPGMIFDDTVNKWHTCKASGRIRTTNPCSEVHFLDDISCNLASLNLLKFRKEDGSFDIGRFKAAIRIFLTAQDILIDNTSYPTALIAENSHKYRPLGLGYTNLGALLMHHGLAYDSDAGRSLAGAITSLMTATAYEHSADMAVCKGPFEGASVSKDGKTNAQHMLEVITLHEQESENRFEAVKMTTPESDAERLWRAATATWEGGASAKGIIYGYRNAQVTLLAPCGTISFLMDGDTTGIEPELALTRTKHLAGGGQLSMVSRSVSAALMALGYSGVTLLQITEHVDKYGTIEDVRDSGTENGPNTSMDVDKHWGRSGLDPKHLQVFDCAMKPRNGNRTIAYEGHLKMMAACQPFLSGAISKTINMPETSTVEDIKAAYYQAWKMGLKAVAIYRDGSKQSAPISTGHKKTPALSGIDWQERAEQLQEEMGLLLTRVNEPVRIHMPDTRQAITHKFSISGQEGYLTVGLYDNGQPGELFVQMAKEGSTIGGLMDTIGTLTSLNLQYGVPIEKLVSKFAYQSFAPDGITPNPDIRFAKSIIDYVFRWLGCQFVPGYRAKTSSQAKSEPTIEAPKEVVHQRSEPVKVELTGGVCPHCGSHRMERAGSCMCCRECGNTSGCS